MHTLNMKHSYGSVWLPRVAQMRAKYNAYYMQPLRMGGSKETPSGQQLEPRREGASQDAPEGVAALVRTTQVQVHLSFWVCFLFFVLASPPLSAGSPRSLRHSPHPLAPCGVLALRGAGPVLWQSRAWGCLAGCWPCLVAVAFVGLSCGSRVRGAALRG